MGLATIRSSILLALLTAAVSFPSFAQTNDPLVSQQQYLFDVHNVDQAWNHTTGSVSVRIGVHSHLGFTQNHEDLSPSRRLTPLGGWVRPELDIASEAVGIAAADTDNNIGMAGIDRHAHVQSLSALRLAQPGDPPEQVISAQLPSGQTEQYYFDLARYAALVNEARHAGIDVHLFTFGVPTGMTTDFPVSLPPGVSNLMFLPSLQAPSPQQSFLSSLRSVATYVINTVCGGSFDSCWNPPDPLRNFRTSIGNLVQLGNQVVIAPAGDLDEEGQETIHYLPAMFDRYVTTVGGMTTNVFDDLIEWSRTRPASYVAVSAYAESMVGLSGSASDAYTTDFGGTVGAASIATSVASLLRAQEPQLSSEDVREILIRTARPIGGGGFSQYTGHGAIDAGAAAAFVANNPMVREVGTVADVQFNASTGNVYYLHGQDFQAYSPCPGQSGCPVVQGELHRFTARVEFTAPFMSPPEIWVRWAESDGIDVSVRSEQNGQIANHYDPFNKELEIVSVNETGFIVEGYYWLARFYTVTGQQHPTAVEIPTSPNNFRVAYTAFGVSSTPPPPPSPTLSLNTSGLNPVLSWNAVGEADSYKVYRGVMTGAPGTILCHDIPQYTEILSTTATSHTDHFVEIDPNGQILACYYVTAVNQNGESDPSNAAGTHGLAPLFAPEAVALTREPPIEFDFDANYPNPFTASTEIRFALPEAASVSLVVVDLLGREVARLVDGPRSAGYHRAHVDGRGWAGGVYLYRIDATGTSGERFTRTGRMTLMR